ncbi:AlpA family phage regulatory protein [Shewanella sp. SR44-4]|jgi:prophage regulatory protein|uniref:helix-turn-helix transcriptional regulator n=1 Tax=Shewanella sp. SR44-4 TaxID=2760935 RepID=UPI0016046589|nr:AlpA family phage regulatory protein [Shewanella sp. SR44-4]
MQSNSNQLINISTMCRNINKGRTTLFCWVRDGKFPQPLRVGKMTLGWTNQQYSTWLASLEADHE